MRKKTLDYVLVWDVGDYKGKLTQKQKKIYSFFSKKVILASSLADNANEVFFNILGDIPCKKVFLTVPQYYISKKCLQELLKINDDSEHNCFVTPRKSDGIAMCFKGGRIIDGLKIPVVLVNTKFPLLIEDLREAFSPFKMVEAWVDQCVPCGFNLIEAEEAVAFYESNKPSNNNQLKVLIYEDAMTEWYNGTSAHVLGVLSGFEQICNTKYRIDVCVKEKIIAAHKLRERFSFTFLTPQEVSGVYDIVFVPAHSFYSANGFLSFLDSHALRIVIWPLDCILFRRNANVTTNFQRFVYDILSDYVDGLVFLSNDAKEDYNSLFCNCNNLRKVVQEVVYIPVDEKKTVDNITLPISNFILVMGNTNPHKMIDRLMHIMIQMKSINFIVIGTSRSGKFADNVYGYMSGTLDEEFVDALFRECNALVFPSVYEGFGLPIVEAIKFYGKDVIAVDRRLNRELQKLSTRCEKSIHLYNNYSELKKLLLNIPNDKGSFLGQMCENTWKDVAHKLFAVFDKITRKPLNLERLENRHKAILSSLFSTFNKQDDCILESRYSILESRYKTLVSIVSTDYSLVHTRKVFDIYGTGVNGRMFYKYARGFFEIGCFVDSDPRQKKGIDIKIVLPQDYIFMPNHILVVTPEYDFDNIKNKFNVSLQEKNDCILKVSELAHFF